MQLTIMEEKRRRLGPDFWARSMRKIGITTWITIVSMSILVVVGKQYIEPLLKAATNMELGANWDESLIRLALYLMLYLASISVIGFMVNSRKPAHKEKKFVASFQLLGILSLIGIMLHAMLLII